MLIEWKVIHKGGPAGLAEEAAAQRLGKSKAGRANRNTRKIVEWLAAQPTIIWKDEIKKSLGDERGNGTQRGKP
jgi:hypothetical protein